MSSRAGTFRSALAAVIIVILVAAPQAQQAQQAQAFAAAAATAVPVREPVREPIDRPTDIDLLVGRSTILNVGNPIARVSLTVPDIADAMVTSPGQLLIHGKQPGTISLFIWDRAGAIKTYEVTVRRDLSALIAQMTQLFPGEPVSVVGSGKDVVISGTVSSKYVVEKAADVAGGYVEKKENVVNLLKVQEGVASNQVMLRVRFAEVSRSAVQELGASYFLNKTNWAGRVVPPGVPAPVFDTDKGGLVFSDFLNLFVFNNPSGLGAAVKAMQTKGLFQSLAEPNLVAIDGKEASFLAGGEFPIPIVQSGSGANSVTVTFKEFGVRLSFTPTVLGGDLVRLKVKPEVSSLDFANAVVVSGFRIPALTTRRTETEVELRDGQTFAIAGLLNNTLTNSLSKIPGIGDIPILGKLFQSAAHQKNLTELVVMITPVILKRGAMGASEGLPALVAPYLGAPPKTYPTPEPYVNSPRYPGTTQVAPRRSEAEPQATDPGSRTATPAPAPEPIAARPIQAPGTLPQITASAPPAAAPAMSAPSAPQGAAPVATPDYVAPPAPAPEDAGPPPPTKAELKALEKQRMQEKKAADEAARRKAIEDKRKAEEDKALQKKAEADRLISERVAKERAAREAELARRDAEVARVKALEDQKRDKVLADAAARLKQAQAEYQAELDKAQGSKDDKAKKSAPVPQSAPRR